MHNFTHDLIDWDEINAITSPNGHRVYEVEDKLYTSVTTMLGASKDVEASKMLTAWRDRLGHTKADKETKRCSDRGTDVHFALEEFVGNLKTWEEAIKNLSMWYKMGMKSVKPYIKKISNVRAQEIALFSHIFKLAGRCDLIADYDNIPSVIDYKTSTKKKQKDWIGDYFLQTAIYSYMLEEIYGIRYTQLVVIIMVEGEPSQVFISQRENHKVELLERIQQFRRITSNEQ